MAQEVPVSSAATPHDRKDTRVAAVGKRQFTIATLMLTLTIAGMGCAAVRLLGTVWLVPVIFVSLSTFSVMLAVFRRSSWRSLSLGPWHSALWFAVAAPASGLGVRVCLTYNNVAGTDKSPGQILKASIAVLAGPLVGPIMNPAAGATAAAWTATALLLVILVAAVCPYLLGRRAVPAHVAGPCWMIYGGATVLWFAGAVLSLGLFLS